MKIVIAPDSFKGSCSSLQVAKSIERGILKVFPDSEITILSAADGGEGTVEAILQSTKGVLIKEKVTGPDGNEVFASYAIIDNTTAIIEMASASGLPLIAEAKRDALSATTFGTGELIQSAISRGCNKIVLGLGGSATTDGGVGMARALGFSFKDCDGNEIQLGGGSLSDLVMIDSSGVDSRLKYVEFIAACDVTNPLSGENGAAYIYSPQKGASVDEVRLLDAGLWNLSEVFKSQYEQNYGKIPGAGAAGGLGFGVIAFLNGRLESGIDTVLDAIDFDNHLKDTDLIITGEGKIDGQSVNGKVPVGIGLRAKKSNIPLLVIAGGIGSEIDDLYNYGITSITSIVDGCMPLSEAMRNGEKLIEQCAERTMRTFKAGMMVRS